MTDAPICHIPPVVPPSQPKPVALPSIPLAHDLHSAIAAINAMRVTIMYLSGQRPAHNPQFTNNATSKQDKPQRWTENARVVETVRVFNPNDKSQYVDVERINQLTMKDGITGESWTWDRNRK